MTSASGGGNEVGRVEGLEPAWGVSGASKQGLNPSVTSLALADGFFTTSITCEAHIREQLINNAVIVSGQR